MRRNISLCLIVKNDTKEVVHAMEAIKSVEDYVDEVIIDVNGGKDIPEPFRIYNTLHRKWEGDFAKARNDNFKRATGDWIIWMDADDVFEGSKQLRDLVEVADNAGKSGIYLPYHYQIDEQGMPIEIHWKLQIVKNDGHGKWVGRIHEDFLPDRAVNYTKLKSIKRIHKYGNENHAEKMERNLKILLEDLEIQGEDPDPRTLLYAAKSYLTLGEDDIAEKFLLKYIALSGWEDEIYDAHLLLAEVHREEPELAIADCTNASILKTELPEAYFAIASLYVSMESWSKAMTYLETGMSKNISFDRTSVFWADVTWKPLAQYAYCLMQTGQLKEAREYAAKAGALGADVGELTGLIDKNLDNQETAKSILQVAKRLTEDGEEEKIPSLMNSVPTALQDNPYVLSVRFKHMPPKTWGEKEVVFYCPRSVEPWSPDSLKKGGTGIGGSETAVINLSKEWVKLGYKVTVYNWCSTLEGEYEGVNYVNYWNFNYQDKFNVLIAWRYPELFDLDIDAKFKAVDVHDVMSPADFTPSRIENVDAIFIKTESHADCFPNIPREKFAIINNGLDLERFKGKGKKVPFRAIYSSTPNRGLDILLDSWHNIRQEVPEAELHVFYGFKTFYELEKNNPERMKWMKAIEDKVNSTEGVVWHDRVDQDTLAEEFEKSYVWAYPTYFYEISCITAMEAMAAGAYPVTINYGALKETINGHGTVIDGDIYLPEVQQQWTAEVIQRLKSQDIDTEGREYVENELSWENIASKWAAVWKR